MRIKIPVPDLRKKTRKKISHGIILDVLGFEKKTNVYSTLLNRKHEKNRPE